MRYISIQKKPTLWGELLMVFIISLYISIPSFQSLMVRLKVFSIYCIVIINSISIPYGAIIMIQSYKMFLDIPNFFDTILYVFLLIFINVFYKLLKYNKLLSLFNII